MRFVAPSVLLSAFLYHHAGLSQTLSLQSAPKTLSRSELRECIQREEELGRRQDAIREANAAQDASTTRLSVEALELARILRETDSGDSVAMEAYNKRVDARNLQVELHNKRTDALNAAVEDIKQSEASYIAACVSRPFFRADESAVLKELGLKERRADRELRQSPPRARSKSEL